MFKEQIRDQLAEATLLLPSAVRMQISCTVRPGCNWMNLWKPTINALGQVLGHVPGADPGDHSTAASWTWAYTATSARH
jgi:hypothetical protein